MVFNLNHWCALHSNIQFIWSIEYCTVHSPELYIKRIIKLWHLVYINKIIKYGLALLEHFAALAPVAWLTKPSSMQLKQNVISTIKSNLTKTVAPGTDFLQMIHPDYWKKPFTVNTHWTKFYSQCKMPDVGCAGSWMFCHFCAFSYRFNIRRMQELVLILAANVFVNLDS